MTHSKKARKTGLLTRTNRGIGTGLAPGPSAEFPLTRILSLAAVGAVVVLTAVNPSARADELSQNLGPVGPHQPILTTVGNKRVIAFYEPDSGHCVLHAVVWDTADVNADTMARLRTNLNPRQMVTIDTPDNQSLNLQCGDNADSLAIVENKDFVAAGVAN